MSPVMSYPGVGIAGSAVAGGLHPLRGLPLGLHVILSGDTPATYETRWEEALLDEDLTTLEVLARHIYLNGELRAEVSGVTSHPLPGIREDVANRIDLLSLTSVEADSFDETNLFVQILTGSRVLLDWSAITPPTDSDWAGCKIYYDNGNGGAPWLLLDTVYGPLQTQWISGALTEGVTYQFRRTLFDHLGNETDVASSSSASATIEIAPLAPTSPSLSWDDGTQALTVSWTDPVGQSSDVVGYGIFTNEAPGLGWAEMPNLGPEWMKALVGTGVQTYDLPVYCSGDGDTQTWKVVVQALDKWGLWSDYEILEITLSGDPGALTDITVPTEKPLRVTGEPLADAKVSLTWEHSEADGTTHFRILRDGSSYDIQAASGAGLHEWESSSMADATAYDFSIQPYNAAGDGPISDSVEVLTDGSAPSGSTSMSATLIG